MRDKTYVKIWPYAGDIPYIDFTINNFSTFFSSSDQKTYTYISNLKLPKALLKTDGVGSQPKWAFVVSNGETEVSLEENRNTYYLAINNQNKKNQVEYEISLEQAQNISSSFKQALKETKAILSKKQKVQYRPFSKGYTYSSDLQTISFKLDQNV